MYKNIVVAIDLEKNCTSVIEKAVKLAKLYDAQLNFIYVSQMVIIDSNYELGNSNVITPSDNHDNQHRLLEIIDQVSQMGVKASGKIVKGLNIANTFLEDIYEEYKYDLIICGSNNKSEFVEFFLGSVSSKIADKAKTDVYIVKK